LALDLRWVPVSFGRFGSPFAVDFSLLQNSNESFSVGDVWDGQNVNFEVVSKWVASKLKGIASCIGVAFFKV